MFATNAVTVIEIVGLVAGLKLFFKTKWGDVIASFFPFPFWVYFFAILFSTVHILPRESDVYPYFSSLVLSGAIFLMLVGIPLRDIFHMGSKATTAMLIASGTMFFAAIVSYAFMATRLPADGDSAVGALLGTWVGGSANMIAVKEILNTSDETLGALVLVDTLLSYSWMALLLLGVGLQKRFDAVEVPSKAQIEALASSRIEEKGAERTTPPIWTVPVLVSVGLIMGAMLMKTGKFIGATFPILSGTAWALLLATAGATAAASTPLQSLSKWKSSTVGSFFLYTVLVTIGAKSSLRFTSSLHYFFILGLLILFIHGTLTLILGRFFKIPLSLLATASQANVGGVVSAPVVAETYSKGTAHFGVLMGVLGTVLGTYVGVIGGSFCHWLKSLVLGG